MATYQLISVAPASVQSASLNSTKVKVISNVACYYAVGINPIAYETGNCAMLPANTVRDIIVGDGTFTSNWTALGNVVTSVTKPKIAFQSISGSSGAPAYISITEIGTVDFARTAD